MNRCRFCLLVVMMAAAVPAQAGIFFNRKPKTPSPERVPQLIYALKSEQNERKRAEAAEELRNFDPGVSPEIVPALSESALKDPQASVRIEAIQSLGKLRPISQQAGKVIEQAAAHDPSVRVQLQARSVLIQYRMSGYHSGRADTLLPPARTIKTEEPPLALPLEQSAKPMPTPRGPANSITPSSAPRPMPSTPAPTPLIPTPPPPLETPPPSEDGPELTPPK